MLEMLLAGKKPKGSALASFRVVCYASMSGNAIGVFELELYDANGNNLCRTPGSIPVAFHSPKAASGPNVDAVNYPASNAIDGNWTNWPRTAYATCAADGSAFLQYDFPVPVNLSWWRIIFEGAFVPTPTGFELQQLVNGTWKTVKGTMTPSSGYYSGQWYTFTGLTLQ